MRKALILFAWALVAALLLRFAVVEVFRVSSDSMLPQLATGDVVVVTKLDYALRLPLSSYEIVSWSRPKPGTIVAFQLPERGLEVFIKRVVAVAGDRVQFVDGKLVINDVPVPTQANGDGVFEETLGATTYKLTAEPPKNFKYGPVAVPKDHFFVLGDNRTESSDSRDWGPIPYGYLRGRYRFALSSH